MIRTCDCLDRQFHALADDTRLKIIELLRDYPLNAGEIASYFTISHASMSYHLQKLEQCNLVTVEKLGRYKKYRLNKEAKEEFNNLVYARTVSDIENRCKRMGITLRVFMDWINRDIFGIAVSCDEEKFQAVVML